MTGKKGSSPESIVREIKRQTRRKFGAERKGRVEPPRPIARRRRPPRGGFGQPEEGDQARPEIRAWVLRSRYYPGQEKGQARRSDALLQEGPLSPAR